MDEIGKEISGTGMDTKIVGRIMIINETDCERPKITRIFVKNISELTDENDIGLGLADYTTEKVVNKLNSSVTALNCTTGCTPEKGRVPIELLDDREVP